MLRLKVEGQSCFVKQIETAVEDWYQGIGDPQGETAELKEELKDHLCCEIEVLLEIGENRESS